MNILMVTNTYLPHVGGVAQSVLRFAEIFRRRGHSVLIAAPEFRDMPDDETDVVRLPAIQNFNGSDFSVRLPIPGLLSAGLERFPPDIIHAHHPFFLGDTALRIAARLNVPLVFTHHTMYEQYTHYVPGHLEGMKRFVVRLATEYANLADHVIAPSESVAELLRSRGVVQPITSIATGVDAKCFSAGNGANLRRRLGIAPRALVAGYVGRLAPEKNLQLLAEAVASFMEKCSGAHFVIAGAGPSEEPIRSVFDERGITARVHFTGALRGQALSDAYHAMDVFAFASRSETQGMVLAEAMTAGVPVVAIDAPGVREIVRDGENGRLLREDAAADDLAEALQQVAGQSAGEKRKLVRGARKTAKEFSMSRCADQMLSIYQSLLDTGHAAYDFDDSPWAAALRGVQEEWNIWIRIGRAVGDALGGKSATSPMVG